MTDIRKVQLVELNLLRIFVDICEKEQLTYYMSAGTMLGAVRHGGYIPWDDDTDVMMPRKDYDRFLHVAEQYLTDKDGILLETYRGTDDYLRYPSRLSDRRVKIKVSYSTVGRIENVWLDIYPVDGMPDGRLAFKIHEFRLLYHRALFVYSQFAEYVHPDKSDRPWYEKALIWVGYHFPVQRLFSPHKAWVAQDKAMRKYACETCGRWINFAGGYKLKEIFPKAVYGKGTEYEFEGMKLIGLDNYDAYLTGLYGDYMTPPPERDRDGHCAEIIEIEEDILYKICERKLCNIDKQGGYL